MKPTTYLPTILTTLLTTTATATPTSLDITLYADASCSELIGGMTLAPGTCANDTTIAWASMEITSPPSDGTVIMYADTHCCGDEQSVSGMYLGCMEQRDGFVGRSATFEGA